nr:MAG TPA: hypothetical protein [Caudoviricetes sp.]
MQIGNIRNGTTNFSNPQAGRVYDIDDVAPTLNTMTGGWQSTIDCSGGFVWR